MKSFKYYFFEAKEAPKGKHYDSAGRLRSGDADADGRGGPKYRSDPTYKNPNENNEDDLEDEEAPEEDAEYRGRKVKLNKPMRGDVKILKVCVE